MLDNLNNLNKKVGNETSRYEVAVEKSNNYNLINETSSLEKEYLPKEKEYALQIHYWMHLKIWILAVKIHLNSII